MRQEIFGLRCDFVYRRSHYMELYKVDGIAPEELSSLQLRMLAENRPPNVLPLEVQEVDFKIRLLYNLASKRMLAHALKVEGLTKQRFVDLLYALVCTLEESANYMLDERGFVLKEQFIFIGYDWSDIYLTYVPLLEIQEEISPLASLHIFIQQLSGKVKEEEREDVKAWGESLAKLRDLSEIKAKLLSLMNVKESRADRTTPAEPLRSSQDQEMNRPGSNDEELKEKDWVETEETTGRSSHSLPGAVWNRNEHAHVRNSIDSNSVAGGETEGTGRVIFVAAAQRTQIIVIAGLLLLSAFLWQNYLTYPGTASFRISAGLTLLFVDVCFVLKFIGAPQWKSDSRPQFPKLFSAEAKANENMEQSGIFAPQASIQEHYKNLHLHTTLLGNSKPNATVFLGNMLKLQSKARLEMMEEGIKRSIPMESDSFTIGRGDADAEVHCVLEESGVSRLHAEIFKDGEQYGIKDLGSTNGTFLNGEQLVAYQAYPLREGDVVRIIRVEMTFRE